MPGNTSGNFPHNYYATCAVNDSKEAKAHSSVAKFFRAPRRPSLSLGDHELKLRAFSILALSALSHLAWAAGSDCTMQPAPIDISRITHRPEVKSYTVDANKLGVTALLHNGRALRLTHMGCAHSGAEAALWFQSEVPASDVKKMAQGSGGLSQYCLLARHRERHRTQSKKWEV